MGFCRIILVFLGKPVKTILLDISARLGDHPFDQSVFWHPAMEFLDYHAVLTKVKTPAPTFITVKMGFWTH